MKIQVIADDQVRQRYDCVVCGDTITRCADGVVGLRYGCKSSSVAHPLCVQLQRIQNPSSIGRKVGKAAVKVFISGTRSVILNSVGVPDFFAAWDAFDALYTIWDLVSSAKEITSAFSDEPTFLGELQAIDATDVLGDLSGTAVEDDNFQVASSSLADDVCSSSEEVRR